jgi:hypothetical protein
MIALRACRYHVMSVKLTRSARYQGDFLNLQEKYFHEGFLRDYCVNSVMNLL